ncbi:MAG: rhamnulokinase [Phycisphaerae bacterium]
MSNTFLAIDFGAESGRGILVRLNEGKVSMEEIHRFPSRNVVMGDTRYWDFPGLWAEVLETLKIAAETGEKIDAIGVDTWGVDFGLLGKDGRLLANPVHYRDPRTENIHDTAERVMPIREIWDRTALQTMPINTLFQLHAMQLQDSPLLYAADSILWMPDLFNYFLTGQERCELSEAQTGQLVGPDRQWCDEIISRFGLPDEIFGELIEPGNVIGPVRESVQAQTGIGPVPVVAVASHDTGAAVAAVPAEGDNWAYLSCGTWSIMGKPVDEPIAAPEAHERGFSNEVTYGGWYLCHNILGLWLVQELRRKWDASDDPWDYDRITAEAAKAESGPLVNVNDPTLLAPTDMEEALINAMRKASQPRPEGRGQLVRTVLESLALQYALGIDTIEELSGKRPDALYIVGGGIKNKLLCQFTANACGMPVHAGADQCTALGNALGQALALGVLETPQQIRDVMRASTEMTSYQPENQQLWNAKREQYRQVQREQ